jgi:hypothetical protein
MNDTAELQTKVSREGWARYWSAEAARAGTPASREVAAFIAAHERKHGKASESKHVEPVSAEPGPQTQAALKVVAAIARAKAGQVAEANGGSGRVFGNHKLPAYRVGGRI